MMRLLWKEWHERRLWLGLWVLAVVATAALRRGQSIFGDMEATSEWMMVPILLAMLTGLGGYGSELKGERATFLCSRALRWWQVLIAKVSLGMVTALVAVLLGALVSLVVYPPAYRPFLTPAGLTLGALIMAAFTGGAFLLGLGFSLALPGLAGAVLVFFIWFGVFFLTGSILDASSLHITPAWMMIGSVAGPLLAAVVLARFGLTLGHGARLRRFLLLAGIPLLLGVAGDLIPPVHRVLDNEDEVTTIIHLSPSGKYAVSITNVHGRDTYTVVVMADGRRLSLPKPVQQSTLTEWLPNDAMIFTVYKSNGDRTPPVTFIAYPEPHQVTITRADVPYWGLSNAVSPDGRRLLVNTSSELRLIDLASSTNRVIARSPKTKRYSRARFIQYAWWQDSATAGYLLPSSDPHATATRVLVPAGQ